MYNPENLKALRISGFFSQQEIAKVLNISPSAYSHMENNARRPDIDMLYELSQFYRVHMEIFFQRHSRRFISDISFLNVMSEQEKTLIEDFASLSEFSKGKLLERVQVLKEEDEALCKRLEEDYAKTHPNKPKRKLAVK